jgi:hypothetical protein
LRELSITSLCMDRWSLLSPKRKWRGLTVDTTEIKKAVLWLIGSRTTSAFSAGIPLDLGGIGRQASVDAGREASA